MDLVALQSSRFFDDPVQERAAQSVTFLFRVRNQIVDVENFAPGEKVQDAVAGGSGKDAIKFQKNHSIAFRILDWDLFAKFGGGQMRAQVSEDSERALHIALVAGVEELNGVFHSLNSPMR